MEYLSSIGFSKVMEQFASADPNLNQFGYGQFYNENGQPKVKQVYPGMWINPTTTNFLSEYAITRTYQVIIYDLVYLDQSGNSNQNAVVSDCEEIAFRLCRYLRTASEVFDIDNEPVIEPMSDMWLDRVSGVTLNITLQFNAISQNCCDPVYQFAIKTIEGDC